MSKPHLIYDDKLQHIDECKEKLISAINAVLDEKKLSLRMKIQKLDLLSPLSILERGYSVCFKKNGDVVKTGSQVMPEEIIKIMLHKNSIFAKAVER
jgi:exodeoxyribonuclease VII large subunit